MMGIRRLVRICGTLCALSCVLCFKAAAADVVYSKFDGRVVDELVRECAESYRIRQFTEDEGRLPLVILGAFWVNNTWGDIWEDVDIFPFMRRLQDALINSSDVLEFVASSYEREVLREEKRDQDFHASIDSAKAMDNETAADFMLQGELGLLGATEKELYCQLAIQLVDIETNRIVFSSVKDVTIKSVKVKTAKQTREKKEKKRDTISTADREPSGNWDTYQTYSLAVPVVRRSFDGDGGDADCEFRAVTVGYDRQAFHVNYPTHITLMTKYGFAFGAGTMSADYGRGEEMEQELIFDFMVYTRAGAGFAITLGGVVLVPTAGVGVSFEGLRRTEHAGDDDEKTYKGCDVTVDGFVNLTAMLMFVDSAGLSLSLELSKNLCGAGSYTELETYGINFDLVSFIPSIGFCCRL